MREIEIAVPPDEDGSQVRDFLRRFGVSSSLLKKLKKTPNGITKNGIAVLALDRVKNGDLLKISITDSGHMPSKTKMNIPVVYEDEDIIVLDKPPFMPVHESRNHRGDTLSNFVSYHLNGDFAFRAVYRLDRDTSGLVLAAKNEFAAAALSGKIKKDYFAAVSGTVDSCGFVDAPIARCSDSIIKRCVRSDGDPALTHYSPVALFNGGTLLKLSLDTGRTHQIRVHMAHIGHPLLGDSMYGGSADLINRQALHCAKIYFVHPVTKKAMQLSSPLPEDMAFLIK